MTLSRDGQERTVVARIAGSATSARLATIGFRHGEDVRRRLREVGPSRNRPCAMLGSPPRARRAADRSPQACSASQQRRIWRNIANFTDSCLEMAPAGWHLWGTSVPGTGNR